MEQEKEVTSALVSALVVDAERKNVGDAIKQKRGFFGNFSQRGGGPSEFPKLLQNNQVIFGMPKSFLGAKTCFTIVGR